MANYRNLLAPILVGEESGEYRAWCPQHETPGEGKPSATVRFDDEEATDGVWHCHSRSCHGKGKTARVAHAYALVKKRGLKRVAGDNVASLGAHRERKQSGRNGKSARKGPTGITIDVVEAWESALKSNKKAMAYLRNQRGLRDETIKSFRIGWSSQKQRLAIPVFNSKGDLVNARMYKLPDERVGQDGSDIPKMVWYVSMANGGKKCQPPFFALDKLDRKQAERWVIEGEWDTLIAHQIGLNAVGQMRGAKRFQLPWGRYFSGRIMYICFDSDGAGAAGADHVAAVVRKHESPPATIMLTKPKMPKSDLTDMIAKHGWSGDDLVLQLRGEAVEKWRKPAEGLEEKGERVVLRDALDANRWRKPIEVDATVIGKESDIQSLYKFTVHCREDKGKKCLDCPMEGRGIAGREFKWPANDSVHIDYIGADTEPAKNKVVANDQGLHCSSIVVPDDADSMRPMNVERLVVTNSIEASDDGYTGNANDMYLAYNIGDYRTTDQQTYRYVGMPTATKDKRYAMQFWHREIVGSSIDTFEMTPAVMKRLRKFQAKRGQSPYEKMVEIADDLSNITGMVKRQTLNVAYDLVWHSSLNFIFDGKTEHGWLQAMVIGDSRTGKTELAKSLREHYGAGHVYSCDNASYAGLVAGKQQVAGMFMNVWGALPMNDRRLIVLDETNSLVGHEDRIIPAMSSIRSEGIAEINKIGGGRAFARVRQIWIANPTTGKPLRSLPNHGVNALQQMFKAHEDIARFDFALAVPANVSGEEINRRGSTADERISKYDPQSCSELVMWAWSRRPEQILFSEEAGDLIMERATELGNRYTKDIPLIQPENVRIKLARIAVAVALRTFSSDPTGEFTLVNPEHVDAAVEFLDAIYGDDMMPYQAISDDHFDRQEVGEEKRDAMIKMFKNEWAEFGAFVMSTEGALWTNNEAAQAAMGIDAQAMLTELQHGGFLNRRGQRYAATASLIDLLKQAGVKP